MTDFRQNFLDESIKTLTDLEKELAEDFSENLRREAFRVVHTVKGGAQTFGLESAARLAHQLETILSNNSPFTDKNLLFKGIVTLTNCLRQGEADSPADFTEKLRNADQTAAKNDVLLTKVPLEVFKSFSEQERRATLSALREGKNIYCAEVRFEAADFAARYRELRKILSEKSEILASLPGDKTKEDGKIRFRIFLASRETAEHLRECVKAFDAEISSHACLENDSKDLYKMLSQIAAHVESIAAKAGKEVDISILSNVSTLSAGRMKAFFDILLQLIRNAVDHAIERTGAIEIRLFEEPQGFYLSVADDGCGIDLERVRARAAAKNLIREDDFPDEQQTLALIFASEFSTAASVTQTSGRGVGLDAVRAAVEKMNGKIFVRNRKIKGAIFEIYVPLEKI